MATSPSASNSLPLAVWPSAQQTAQHQRAGRYVGESAQHPGKMLPSLARRIVEEYSSSGDLVVDPMAGIGTTLVEAASIDRRCIGIELEPRWAAIGNANLDHILDGDQRALAEVRVGDARKLRDVLGEASGHVDLICTSPPYACEVATVDRSSPNKLLRGQESCNYSANRDNIGHARGSKYAAEMLAVYKACFDVLRPGGFLVTVTKNMRKEGRMVDVAGTTVTLAHQAGFIYFQHVVSLLCGIRDGELVGRPSFFQHKQVKAARAKGQPVLLTAHEDLLVFQKSVAK